MEPNASAKRNHKILVVIALLVIAAGLIGWFIGNSNKSPGNTSSDSTAPGSTNTPAATSGVKSLVSYTLPDGWKEGTCSNAADRVYIIPGGAELNCSADPSAPIKLYIDPQNTTDCNQLGNVQNVRKHVCISLYIGGHKSLKASTEYPASSSYGVNTTISDYYINTGKGVVKVEYTYTSSNEYQAGFDQLAMSVKTK